MELLISFSKQETINDICIHFSCKDGIQNLNLLFLGIYRKSTRFLKAFIYCVFISSRLTFSDILLIVDSFIQKSLLPYFTSYSPLEPDWFKISHPFFWHPFKGIIVTVTIYLMVAISAERFRAVCYPLSKRQVSINDNTSLRKIK